jgi:ankyrin repeat protein
MGNVDFFVEQQKMGEDHMERCYCACCCHDG